MKAMRALTSSCRLAGASWLFAGILGAMVLVRGPAAGDGFDLVFGLAAGLAWPLYVATGDMDRVRLQRIGPLPDTAELLPGPSARFVLGLLVLVATLLAAAFAFLPGDALDISVAGLAVGVTLAPAATGRPAQLWWWERRHPGQRLFDVSDGDDTWVASGTVRTVSDAELAFGHRRRQGVAP